MIRPRGKHIKVYGTPEERAEIAKRATSASLSQSAYLLASGLNRQIRPAMDIGAVTELSKLNGELGRLAELLKTQPGSDKLIKELRELQKQSHNIMGKMTKERK